MATHSELLAVGWFGSVYHLQREDFGTDDAAFAGGLNWLPENVLPKPTLADLEARRAEIEAAIALRERQKKWRDELIFKTDNLLQVIKALANGLDEVQAKLKAQSLTTPLSAQTQSQIDALLAKIAQIEAIT